MAKPESISDYRDATQGHRRTGHHGIEQPTGEWIKQTGGEGHPNGVVDEGEKEILADVFHDITAQAQGADDAP